MIVRKSSTLPIRTEGDVVMVRLAVRALAAELRFSLVDQTKLVTAASELARNALIYGGGGDALVEGLEDGGRVGVRVTFTDQGPGIPDLAQAMQDGYTTGGGLGLGMGGAKRLVNDFDVDSAPGRGTRITITRWR